MAAEAMDELRHGFLEGTPPPPLSPPSEILPVPYGPPNDTLCVTGLTRSSEDEVIGVVQRPVQ